MDLVTLRRSAAELVALAVFELFPQVELLGGTDTSVGFFCDVYFPHPVHPDTVLLIEERMRQIVREGRPIKTLEMAPFSAREFLKKEGHLRRAEELEGEEGLVELVEIGSFHNLSQGPHAKNTAELGAFKMEGIEKLDDSEIRLTGFIYPSKTELKQFLKKLQTYTDPREFGETLGLWRNIDKDLVWLERGLRLKDCFVQFLKRKFLVGALEVSGGHHKQIAQQMGVLRVIEITPDEVQISSFPREPASEFNSLLQLVEKTLIMLGFNYSLNRAGALLFEVEDGLGRKWPSVIVKDHSIQVPIERNLFLLLERYDDPKQLMERLEQL